MKKYNIRDFGAVGNGLANDTEAIQKAVDIISNNCGEIFIPEGTYKITTIFLKSHIHMNFAKGSLLIASPDTTDWENFNRRPLFYGQSAIDITLYGLGTINCNGPVFHNTDGTRVETARPQTAILFENCSHVSLTGLTIKNSVGWTIHFDNCEHIAVDRITIRNPIFSVAKNTDGIDINGCRHVEIMNCDIETGDDAICLKNMSMGCYSVKRLEMYDILIQDCVLASTCNITKIGTETFGDISDVTFNRIVVNKHSSLLVSNHPVVNNRSISAISIQSNDGSKIHDITFKNYLVNETDTPIFILLANRRMKIPDAQVGSIDNITLDSIEVKKSFRTSVINICSGHSAGRITLNNSKIYNLENRYSETSPRRPDNEYPEPWKYGIMPAYGLFARNVSKLVLSEDNVFYDTGSSGRPEKVFENVSCNNI